MFSWLRNINRKKVMVPSHDLEPFLSTRINSINEDHISRHLLFFKEGMSKNNKKDVLKYLDIHLEDAERYLQNSVLHYQIRDSKRHKHKIQRIKQMIEESDKVLLVVDDIEKKKEGRKVKYQVNNLGFINETSFFMISKDILSSYKSHIGQPYLVYSISHFGYHHINFSFSDTLISKGIPNRIVCTSSHGEESVISRPKIIYSKQTDKGAKKEWVERFNSYYDFVSKTTLSD